MTENISYKGKEYPVSIGYYALKHTSREMRADNAGKELSMEQILSGDLETYEPLLWHSLVMGQKETDPNFKAEDFDLKRDQMELMLNDVMFEFIALVPLFFPKGDDSKNLNKGATVIPSKKK